jgi:hypothetical protein
MSFARGFARGFLKQGLEEKAARDQAHAEMVKELGAEFRQASKLFRQEEKDIQNRFNNIRSEKGLPMALYSSYQGLTKTDYGMKLALEAPKEFIDSIENFDFQGYDFNSAKSQRLMNFADTNKDAIELFKKNQGSDKFAEFYLGDIKPKDQVTRPDLDLPAISSVPEVTGISAQEMRDYRKAAFAEFKAIEKDEFAKEFKENFAKDYDPNNPEHGPSKDLYGFRRYFNEFYLPEVIGAKTDTSMKTQMQDVTGAQQTGETTTFSIDNTFTFNGKLYNIPNQFKGQSIPEITKKAIASQQDKEAPTKNNPNVLSAQRAIDIIKAQNPNDPRIEDIKRDLRLILGVTNLDGLIS